MARTETVFKMSIDDGNSVKTLKDLDKNSESLKKSMNDLADSGEKTSDEFKDLNKAYEETIDTQKKLMGDMEHLGGDIMVEVSGSISKMEDRLYELALAGDTTSKEFIDLQNKTAKYKQIVIETDRSIDALAEQGRGLSAALSISSGAVAGFQAFTSVTTLLGTENEELLQTIVKLQAAQGVLNSIEVIKQQLQANSIALTRARTAVQKAYNVAIGNGTKATKLFRGALLATGIGAVIIAIGLLIANFDKLKNMMSGVSEAQKVSNEVSNKALDAYAEQASAADRLTKTLDDETLSREDQISAVKDLQTKYPGLLSNIDAETASREDVNKALLLNISLLRLQAEIEAANELRTEKFKERLQIKLDVESGANVSAWDAWTTIAPSADKIKKNANATSLETSKRLVDETKSLDDLIAKKEEEARLLAKNGAVIGGGKKTPKKTSGGGKSAGQTRIEEEAKAALELALLQEELRRMTLSALDLEELAITDKFDRLSERAGNSTEVLEQINAQQDIDMNKLFAKRKAAEDEAAQVITDIQVASENRLQDELSKLQDDYLTEDKQKELNAVSDKYFSLIELAEQNGLDASMLRQRQLEEEAIIEKTHSDKLVKIKEKEIQDKISIVSGGLNAVSDLNTLVSDLAIQRAEGDSKKQEKIAKHSFNVNKALQLGLAVIDGYKAINASLAFAPLAVGVIPNPVGIASLAVAASTTAINIAKIAASRYKGNGSKPSTPGGGLGAGAGAGSFSISDDTSSAQTQLNPDGTPVDSNEPTQVYVSEIDISNVQNKINSIETKSTY